VSVLEERAVQGRARQSARSMTRSMRRVDPLCVKQFVGRLSSRSGGGALGLVRVLVAL